MVFSSITFLFYFLPIVLLAYYIAPTKGKNFVLLLTSLFFYAWGEPVYVLLMIVSILINYLLGLGISAQKFNVRKDKFVLVVAVIINLAFLGFFKYADFAIENINNLFGTSIALLELPLPIGISFYTFQAMSYIIDLYRGDVKLQRNIIDFGTYVALFPQLIAGPIIRLKSIEDSLHRRRHSFDLFASGVRRFVIGLGKKVILANNIGMLWDQISAMNQSEVSTLTAWIGIAAFTFQIYFDFSGYSDMAIGLGRMIGFEFPENFMYPYTSRSITEFWRKWHISLSTWFKEYVYIPLGGNKHGAFKQVRNILIVWMLTGFWHGASWNFIMWGLYFAVLLIAEKAFLLKSLENAPKAIGHIYTMILVMISWVIFSFDDFALAIGYLKNMIGLGGVGFFDSYTLYIISSNIVLFVFLVIGSTEKPKKLGNWIILQLDKIDKRQIVSLIVENLWLVALLLISISYVVASTYNPFLYFRF